MSDHRTSPVHPLRAERFLRAALDHLEPLRGTFIYDPIARDLHQKTEQQDAGYSRWLRELFTYLAHHEGLERPRVLDFGCGTGELTVLMKSLGIDVVGIDVHETHLRLAKILAKENGFSHEMFHMARGETLPFEANSFDLVTMFVVLEHLSDETLGHILKELKRVCSGIVFVLVPNKLQLSDDHTGLRLVPWMPRWMAARYIRLFGKRRRYAISDTGTWDVHYRWLHQIVSMFESNGFRCEFLPDEIVFPPLEAAPPIRGLGKTFNVFGRKIFVGLPLPVKWMQKRGVPPQALYQYLNLIFRTR
jgi:2-polyprenyl-3-methyl-5-hydroxy-6-metoxy-1,4-benzoquinol methylase